MSWALSMSDRSKHNATDNPGPTHYCPSDKFTSQFTHPNRGHTFIIPRPPRQPKPHSSTTTTAATTTSLLAHRTTRKRTSSTSTTTSTGTLTNPNSVFASKVSKDPLKTWLKPNETANCPYFLNPEKTLLNFGYYNSAPQWGRSKSPRMMVHDYIRGEMGTLSSGPESYIDPRRVSRSADEKAKETHAAFKPGNPRLNLPSDKLRLRAPTRSKQMLQRLGTQHLAFSSLTCNSVNAWMKEVTTSNEEVRKQRTTTMHREGDDSDKIDSVLPPWLRQRIYGDASCKNRAAARTTKTKSTTQSSKSIKSINSSFTKKQILTLFGTPPHKRDAKLIRTGAMWLRNTAIGYALPPSLREKLAAGCKLLEINSEAVLSAEIMRERKDVELPQHVYIVLAGMLKQRCKRRSFNTFLVKGDCACELALIDTTFSHDIVTVVGGPSGATVISIPRSLYLNTARAARRCTVMERIASLKCSVLFSDVEDVHLARLALNAKTRQTENGECIVHQDQPLECLVLVVRGSFVLGRCLTQRGENYLPTEDNTGQFQWVCVKRHVNPCTTVGHKRRGDYFGEEAVLKVEKKSWSTVVCDGPGEILMITPALLRVVGAQIAQQTIQRMTSSFESRPADHVLMRKMTMRQQLQRLKVSLIGDELPL